MSSIMLYLRFSPAKEATEGDNKQDTHFSSGVVIVLLLILIIESPPT